MGKDGRPVILLAAWFIAITLAALCVSVFVMGIRRDTRAGEPTIGVALGSPSDWRSMPFRVWQDGRYQLFVSTVNHDPSRVGEPFDGELEVLIRRPSGTVLYQQMFRGENMPHVIPDNYGDTQLALFDLDASATRQWSLAVRVVRPAEAFAGLQSEVKLWLERYDPGMGGLANYVMIIPAGFFAVVSLLVALSLARRRVRYPLIVSALCLLGFLVLSGL